MNYFIDYYKKNMLVITNDNQLFDDNSNYKQLIVISSKDKNINELIEQSDIIVIIGDITVKNEFKDKFVVNINNLKKSGYFTCNLQADNKTECNNIIYSIYNSIFTIGLITIDLYDVASQLNGIFSYKKITDNYIDTLFKLLGEEYNKKIFIVFDCSENITLHDILGMLDSIKKRYKDCELSFGLPMDLDNPVKSISLNVFYEK